ncbi:MAG: LamG domain-containing protein [bacterium]|nr:LamG domain-containing protein [bacterium]
MINSDKSISIINAGESADIDTGVLLSSTFDADSPVVWKTIEWNNPSTSTAPYERGDSRLRKDETDGLVALWHFDEGEDLTGGTSADDSTVYDESTNTNTGIVYGCVWGNASEDSAVFQSALSFDGSNDYVNIGNDASIRMGTQDWTTEAWIYLASTPVSNYTGIVGPNSISTGSKAYLFSILTTRKIHIFVGDGSGVWALNLTSDDAIPLNTWTHVAVTIDRDGTCYMYINGSQNGSTSMSNSVDINGTNTYYIGMGDGGAKITGAIDEVAIYSRAKTAEEILQDAQGTQMRFRTQTTSSILDGTGADSPIGLWHFDNLENSSTSIVAYDSSVYGNNGDFSGAGEPAWYQWGMFGKCVEFDGSDDYVSCVNVNSSVKNAEFWVKADNTSQSLLEFNTSDTVYVLSGTLKAPNLTSPTFYVNGSESTTLTTSWSHVAINYDTGINASAFNIGKAGSTYFAGLIDEVGLYNYVRTADQIAIDARGGHPWSPWSPYYKNADIDDIVLFADDFNDGVVGSDWTAYEDGTWHIDNIADDTGFLQISGLSASAGDTAIIIADNTNWYDEQVEAKVKIKTAGGKSGIIYRKGTGSNYGYVAYLEQGSGVKAYSMDATGLATSKGSSSMTINTNTWYTLKVTSDGTNDRVYVDDAEKISFSNTSTYKAKAGLYAENNTVFDDFKVFPIDRYCHYEATLTDNINNDTTPYLYWVRLSYEETTSDDSIWSRIIQDRHTYSTLTPRDTSITPAEFNYTDIDGADTVWCYNLENYDNQGDNIGVPNGAITVNVATPTTASRVDLRLGIRKTTAVNYPDEWPEDIDDYTWSDWRQYASGEGYEGTAEGDTITWTLTYSTSDLATDFATEGGYILQSRAVSSTGGTEPAPTNFKPNDDNDRRDTAIIYMMRDITPPGAANTTGGVDGTVSVSGYTSTVCANSATNTLWTNVGVKGILSYPESTTCTSYRDNTEYVWFNIESSADDSGIRVKVSDQNQASGRTSDCSDLDEDDTSIRYRYSLDGGTTWNASELLTGISADIAEWAFADTNVWTDRYMVIQANDALAETKPSDDSADDLSLGLYRCSIGTIAPASSTKGENVLIQFAQKDKAGNWGYSHRAATYYATQTSGCSTTGKGYYINVDLLAPDPRITAGPREANYSTSASFEFDDNSADDSPLLSAFKTMLQQGSAKATPDDVSASYRSWTSYQPWSPTSDEGSATFTDLSTTAAQNWYRCFVMAKDEALNECDGADSASYIFQCLTPAPDTIIYSGAFGIITDDDGNYSTTFKFKGEGGNNTGYEYRYCTDGSSWTGWSGTAEYPYSVTSYGNYTFRVQARNLTGGVVDPTPASVTFTIEDPAHPSAIAPPGDPVKYWREESE